MIVRIDYAVSERNPAAHKQPRTAPGEYALVSTFTGCAAGAQAAEQTGEVLAGNGSAAVGVEEDLRPIAVEGDLPAVTKRTAGNALDLHKITSLRVRSCSEAPD
jgi:hypothetical protein